MHFSMQSGRCGAELSMPKIDVFFYSDPLDQRGREAIEYLRRSGAEAKVISYSPDTYMLNIDGRDIFADDVVEELSEFGSRAVAIETTTCGFVEILLLTRALIAGGVKNIVYLYIEPGGYMNFSSRNLIEKRSFALSELFPGYKGVPGYLLTIKPQDQLIFFLGYENPRLTQAFEAHQAMTTANASLVFGVPGFMAGWELNAFANNIQYMHDERMSNAVHFCPANNPESAYQILALQKAALTQGQRLFIAPIGTKPCGIAAAVFACQNDDGLIGILYDHPIRKSDRTEFTHQWNIYTAIIDSTLDSAIAADIAA